MMELARCRCGWIGHERKKLIYESSAGKRNYMHEVVCLNCGAATGNRKTKKEAAEFWNKLMGIGLDELELLMDRPLFGVKLGHYKLEEIVAHKEVLIKVRSMKE